MHIIKITDIDLPELSVFSKLTEAQLRNKIEPKKGIFIAESPKVISLALDAGCVPVSFLMEEKHITGDASQIISRCGDIPVYTAERGILQKLTGYTLTRGVLCAMQRPSPLSAAEICKNARRIAVLDGIVDSTNIGAIFRSAAALGMDAVLLTQQCCDPLVRRAVRVSMGTVFQIPWAYILSETVGLLEFLQQIGFKTVAMALTEKSVRIDDPALISEARLAIILGTEGDGLGQNVIKNADYTVRIPMYHGVDSLNVAAASAVAFWELRAR
ncbi:MAG: RNA methyltransferase [Ruminococcaceae bacterium]|nr:RNA methyltransferase [Oscillospiraceae bacterium]